MLSITEISIRLAGRLLIDHSSAQIVPGARVGLVGRNGTGKSTVVDAIDMVFNQSAGSLADRPTTSAHQHLPAIGRKPGDDGTLRLAAGHAVELLRVHEHALLADAGKGRGCAGVTPSTRTMK